MPFIPTAAATERTLKMKYKTARMNLLAMVILTAFNLVMLVTKSDTYFLFSASVPYFLTLFSMVWCGLHPEYVITDVAYLDPVVFYCCLAISLVILGLYLAAFFLSKKSPGWLILALVMFLLDTGILLLVSGLDFSGLIDLVFHAWVIVYLCLGISANRKLAALAEEQPATAPTENDPLAENAEPAAPYSLLPDTPALRRVDTEVKSRTLLAFEACGRKVLYRRVKRVNELVIDSYVYAEYTAIFEKAHDLCAVLDGHEFSVGYDGMGASYGIVDGETVAEKPRLF